MSDLIQSDITAWHLVFWNRNPTGARWWQADFWQAWWAWGRFRHVSAIGYSPGSAAWVHFNPDVNGMNLRLLALDHEIDALLAIASENGEIVRVPVQDQYFSAIGLVFRGPFTCVTLVKHLVGLRCSALGVNGLYRYVRGIETEPSDAMQQRK